MPLLRLPTPLRPYANGQVEIQLQGKTIAQMMRELSDKYPQLQPQLYGGDGQLRAFVHLFVNDEDMENLQGIDTPVGEEDRVMIIPSVAGGGSA